MRVRLIMMMLLAGAALPGCGVKGPPEPPLPNEANTERQILKETAKEAAIATPAASAVPPDTATSETKTKKDTTPKKKDK